MLANVCILLSVFGVTSPVAAQVESGVTIEQVTIGLDNFYRVGYTTQVRVAVSSQEAIDDVQLEIEVPDGEGITSRNVTPKLSLPTGAGSLVGFAKFGRVNSSLTIRIRRGQAILAEKAISADDVPDALLATQHLVVSLGPDVNVSDALSLRADKKEQETVHGLIKDVRQLPSHWLGYRGVSVAILPGGNRGLASQMSSQQLDALDLWVRMGGHLIFSCGTHADTMLAAGGGLARFAPGDFDRIQQQRQTSGIENFVGKTTRSLSNFVGDNQVRFEIPMALLKNRRGTVLVSEGLGGDRTPMVMRASHGFGHVVFIAVDLAEGPMSQWKDGRRRLMSKLLDVALGVTQRDDSDKQYSQLAQIGFDDLTGQLRAAMDQFRGVRLVPFSWIAALVGLYILLIGPVDYLVLRKMKRRFSWTWFTFPLLVVLACGLAYTLTQTWKGQTLRINQVNIVDIDSQSGMLRGQTWQHIFSPTSRKYDLVAKQTDELFALQEPRGSLATWQGLPGKSFGGMNTSRTSQSTESYEIIYKDLDGSPSVEVAQMPIDVYASRSLSGVVWGQVDLAAVKTLTADVENQLEGDINNPLPVDLKDCLLCFGRWVYPLATMPAGGSTTIDRFSAKTIDGMLTRTKVDVDFKDRSLAWDRKSREISRIMEMMMFHKAAGGTKYTSLVHRFQGEIDFTDHLNQGTALLLGKVEQSPCTLISDASKVGNNSYETSTYVRILLPVSTKKPRASL